MTNGMSSSNLERASARSALLPTKPVSPKLPRQRRVRAAMFALLLGLGFVFLIVFLDRSIKSSRGCHPGGAACRCSASSRR